jgi:hypothetical protein
VPGGLTRVTAGEVQGEAIESTAHPAPDLDQLQPQRAQLRLGHLPRGRPAASGVAPPVGCRMVSIIGRECTSAILRVRN